MSRERLIQAAIAAIIAFLTALGVLNSPLSNDCNCPKHEMQCPCPPAPESPVTPGKDEPEVVLAARKATVRIRSSSSGCTGTLLKCPKVPNARFVLTARHCVNKAGQEWTVVLYDGKTIKAFCQFFSPVGDIALLRIDNAGDLPFARVSDRAPNKGEKVFHVGWGVRNPGSLEYGECLRPSYDWGVWADYRIDASSGDSGSGIFRVDDGTVVGVLCGSHAGGTYGPSWNIAAIVRPDQD